MTRLITLLACLRFLSSSVVLGYVHEEREYRPELEPTYIADEFCWPVAPVYGDFYEKTKTTEAHLDRNIQFTCNVSPLERQDPHIMYKRDQRFHDWDPDRNFGQGGYHTGEDWNGFVQDGRPGWTSDSDEGLPAYSVADCLVIWTEDLPYDTKDTWGKTILTKCKLSNGSYIYPAYAHLQEILVHVGQRVKRGRQIGRIGNAGGGANAYYPVHLHLEMRTWVDPDDHADLFARNGYFSSNDPIWNQYVNPSYVIQHYGGPRIPGSGGDCANGCGGASGLPFVEFVYVDNIASTSAIFHGMVNPNGIATQVYFLWDDDTAFDFKTAPVDVGDAVDNIHFSAMVPTICGGRTYYVKAAAQNATGESSGSVYSFVSGPCTGTNPPPPFSITSASLESDQSVAGRVAKIGVERFATGNGTQLFYDLYRNDTLVYTLQAAQYNGTSFIYDRKGGLYAGQTYSYRITARDGIGTTPSTNTVTVSIPPGEGPETGTPAVATALPDGITANGGYVAADIAGNGQPTDVVFEWGVDNSYGTTTDAVDLPEPTHASQRVRKGLFGLSCDPGTYHYRAVARRNGVPAAYGADQTFTLDCAANTPVTDGKQMPEIATVGLWRMDGAVRTERKTRSEEGTESRRLIVNGYPLSVPGFNGEADGAYRLVRANGESFIADIASPEGKDFTWMGWVKLNNPANDHQLLYLYQPASAGQRQALLLVTQEHAVLSFQNPPAQGAVLWSSSTLPVGVWKHLAFTREAGTYRIYLNGALDTAYSAGSNLDVTTLSTTSTTTCDCDLDEVHLVYGKALSGPEIADYFTSASSFIAQPSAPPAQPPGAAGSLDVRRQSAQFVYIPDYIQQGLDMVGNFTLEAWVKLRTPIPTLSSYTFVSKWGAMPVGRSYNFEYYHNGTNPVLRLTTDSGGGNDAGVEIPYTLPLGVWRHVAVSYSAGTGSAEFFGDCTSLGMVSGLTTSIQNGDGSFFIGSRFGYPSLTFDGLVDDVRVWSVKRAATDIAGACSIAVSGSTPGLVSNWRFDHTLGDSTTSGNTLTAFNGMAFSSEDRSDAPPPPPPTPKKSLDLKRSAPGYAYINDSAQHGLDITGDFTVEAWVKPRAMVGTHTILSKWGAGQGAYWISYGPDGPTRKISVNVSHNGTTETNKMVAYDLGTGSWKHLAVSCRIVAAGECDVYVNTVKVATLTGFPRTIFSGSGRFEMGTAEGRSDRLIDGFLDEVRVWNKARTQTEIANDSARSLTGIESGLIAYYTFDGAVGSIIDKSSYANHLTGANSISFVTDTPF